MALSKPAVIAAGFAAVSSPALAFQPAGWSHSPASVAGDNSQQQVSLKGSSSTSPSAGSSDKLTAAVVGTLAASAALMASASRRQSKVAARGLKSSPGFNTLPEFEKKKNGFEGVIGDQPPLGYWDPLGFSKDGDIEKFKRRREVEIKHGRVAMFATMGYITPEYFKLDGYLSPSENIKFSDVPNGLAAISKVPAAGWGQIFAFIGFIELVYNKSSPEPGNYGKGVFGLGSLGVSASVLDQGVRSKKLKAELANGRLAMMAIIGMFFQDGLTGSAWGDWSLYTDSPLRAFEKELGVQAPVGFWDPVGFTADGNVAAFKRRRSVELKHGRISMLAAMGYMTPEITGKFPGYLSPSTGLKFADIPNGFGALSVVPAAGWAQIAAYMGAVDVLGGFNDYKTGTPGDYGWKVLTSEDATEKQVKLSAELANGRLAMIAILAMFFQNGTVGSTGPEMWLPSNNGWNP
eukprot:CAMPEP_0178398186 /NCGR_PEP_ID=MMETSP0689_2-20121128/14643_1 /TAXON_ID=160604 /ORGANISM="Amphidinium massartii, Strain CS-259" /LENGTH=461 /DNA_ID=CAMNT_0020018941 /DNA_START=81 /DNA_END=1466 /DNA_ORIENTATION=-